MATVAFHRAPRAAGGASPPRGSARRSAARGAQAGGQQSRRRRQRQRTRARAAAASGTRLGNRTHSTPPTQYRRAIGLCIVNDEGEVFVAERLDERGVWQMPQGGIDVGESPMEAALRELEEETGIPPNAVEVLHDSDRWLCYHQNMTVRNCFGREIFFVGQAQRWFLMRLKVPGESAVDLHGVELPEFAGWRWAPFDEVASGTVDFKRDLYAAVVEQFEPIAIAHCARLREQKDLQ